jgi:ribose transport system substrate-binding protein
MKFINVFFILSITLIHTNLDAKENAQLVYEQSFERVNRAIVGSDLWDGPVTGPTIIDDKKVVFVASDLRNGGVNAVAKGVSEAVSHINWNLRFIDGLGSEVRQGAAIREAIAYLPDAIILGGIDAKRHSDVLKIAKQLGITIIGWHASDSILGDESIGLYSNITTDPSSVAEIAVQLAIVDTQGKAQVVVITDPNFSIAALKAKRMIEIINRCTECNLLSIEEVPLGSTASLMPKVIDRLLKIHGSDITHFLVINDLYIDFAVPSLENSRLPRSHLPTSISAGDGSRAAYNRINQDEFQMATVPEPLYLQGWQIVDELNRSFHHLRPSGYSAPVHLVTRDNVADLIGKADVYDPKNNYRAAYLNIWGIK